MKLRDCSILVVCWSLTDFWQWLVNVPVLGFVALILLAILVVLAVFLFSNQ